MRILAAFFGCSVLCCAQWVMTASDNPATRAIALDVHSVRTDDNFTYVESAGLSFHSFGKLEANQYDPPAGPRALKFRVPRSPKPAAAPMSTPLGIIGVFVTGVPIYNPIGTSSYQDQNIWHRDAVAASPALFPVSTPLIVGYALDGYPIRAVAGMPAFFFTISMARSMPPSSSTRPLAFA